MRRDLPVHRHRFGDTQQQEFVVCRDCTKRFGKILYCTVIVVCLARLPETNEERCLPDTEALLFLKTATTATNYPSVNVECD